ncbi:MAG: hypothetical protein QXJ19_00865 [Candidatus Bathyarchaeia archaeon]
MGKLRVRTGDGKRLEFSWKSIEEEENVKRVFEEYINRGYIAIAEDPKTGELKIIKNFDSSFREIDMWPPVYGG